jgi:diphthine-ammonia ligase
MTPDDEVEDMFVLLSEVKRQIPSITAVSSGAIASDYQRLRVESICSRLGLVSLAFLWKQDQTLLLQDMVNCFSIRENLDSSLFQSQFFIFLFRICFT